MQNSTEPSSIRERMEAFLQGSNTPFPAALEEKFPHIFRKIVELWRDPALDHYFQELMIPDRSDRQGFPADAAKEIFYLSILHDSLGITSSPDPEGWASVGSREMNRFFEDRRSGVDRRLTPDSAPPSEEERRRKAERRNWLDRRNPRQ